MPDSTSFDNAKLTIRRAYPQDAPAIAAMLSALCAFEGTQTPFKPIDYARAIERLIDAKEPNYHFIFAEYDGAPAAFISFYFGYDLSSLAQGAHVGDLYVREQFRGTSLGTKLMAAVGKRVLHQSGQWISLTALRSNERAREFYKKRQGVEVPIEFYAWGQQGIERLMKHAEST